ncbi:MAG: ATP-dependent RNA helicase HrpA [Gammaproteobacteria bacterium]|nr:ATP-dependent RNA helicase HrpA [Gammaproteobacteria bacterium]
MLNSLKQALDECQLGDQFRFARQIRELEKSHQSNSAKQSRIEKLAKEIKQSKARCSIREKAIPEEIRFPAELPVAKKSDEIGELLQHHQVLVVAGDTGSGKTTQIPKICLNAGYGRRGIIGHTQPRRLAAVSVANRIAEELDTDVGKGVGYQIRFNETLSESTYLKLMTDGILLAEIQNDRFLNKYDVLIIDEAHERSLNIDFLLGFLTHLLKKRPELKLIITSATIDVEKFAKHFSDAPIISVSGRTFPIETRYQPLPRQAEVTLDSLQTEAILTAINEIVEHDLRTKAISGDLLVFLSSEREIRETAVAIRKRKIPHTEVLPLYSRLRQSEQIKIFSSHKGRRIVLATNVAETSITVPGIKYVIDTGFARISRYSVQSKVQRLPIESISQASANQRQGRCGRISNGICIRLYSEEDFNARPLFTDPEIKRTNLASVILQMLALQLGNVESFPYLDRPEQKAINDGFKLLLELNAITQKRTLTAIGKQMARLRVDPKLARMLVIADSHACLREILIIVSALSIQDPRELSAENRQQAQERLAQFTHEDSDFMSLVNIWDDYELKRQDYSQNQLKKHCRTYFLSYMRMREWREVHRQLLVTSQQLGFRMNKEPGTYEAIHKAIIAGSLNQIANKIDNKNYQGARNKKFTIFSTSVVAKGKAKWVVTGELIETSQTFASMAAKIQPQWIEAMALHLVKREYFEPHWSKKSQSVMAYEKVHLYGLTIIEKSPVQYAKINSDEAREIFISEGLAAAATDSKLDFIKANGEFLATLAKEEEKLRRPDLFVGDREITLFYKERIPAQICSTRELEQWFQEATTAEKVALFMSRENILGNRNKEDLSAIYPDHAPVLKNRLSIDYVFDPGSDRDGATIEIPEQILNQIEQADIDWAVPGTIREKCISLLKGLPKSLRKTLIPISGLVDQILPEMSASDGELLDSLIGQVAIVKNVRLTREDFLHIDLPKHLHNKIRLINAKGAEIGFSENLKELQRKFLQQQDDGSRARHQSTRKPLHAIQRYNLKDWDIEEFPSKVEIGEDLILIRYPGFVDNQDSVSIDLFADPVEAQEKNRVGLARLFMLRSVAQRNQLKRHFSQFLQQNALIIPPALKNLVDDAVFACFIAAFELEDSSPGNKQEFLKRLENGKSRLYGIGEKTAELLRETLQKRFEIIKRLRTFQDQEISYFVQDVEQQLDNLVTEKLFSETSIEILSQFPRYLKAIETRMDKAPHLGRKDKENTELLASYWHTLQELRALHNPQKRQDLIQFRWMLEEFRVSLFAQSLGTSMPVSIKRLEKQLELLKA